MSVKIILKKCCWTKVLMILIRLVLILEAGMSILKSVLKKSVSGKVDADKLGILRGYTS